MNATAAVDHVVLSRIAALAERFRAGDLAAAEYAAFYALTWQVACHGSCFALRRSRFDAKPTVAAVHRCELMTGDDRRRHLVDFLERYELRGVSRRISVALIAWLRGEWTLELRVNVPDVREVLRLQTQGSRPVTVIGAYPRLAQPVLEKPNAFAFMCHDLAHAWQFFHDAESCRAQQRFALQLQRAIDDGWFAAYLADPVFAEKFDYLAADMNTHVMHSLQYLRAILLEFYLRAEAKPAGAALSAASRRQLDDCMARFRDPWNSLASSGADSVKERRYCAALS